ncbi:hypothetical protein MMC17_007913 [Xylographa soralifera]|nr:hypothetical protein [Xylographa soralifera]
MNDDPKEIMCHLLEAFRQVDTGNKFAREEKVLFGGRKEVCGLLFFERHRIRRTNWHSESEVPNGNGIMLLFQQLSGAIAIAIGETVFTNTLVTKVSQNTLVISPETVPAAGAANLKQIAPSPMVLRALQLSYSDAMTGTLNLALASTVLALYFSQAGWSGRAQRESERTEKLPDGRASARR